MRIPLSIKLLAVAAVTAVAGSSIPGCRSGENITRPEGSAPEITGFFAIPTAARPGSDVQVTAEAIDPDGDALQFFWSASGGKIAGHGPTVTWQAPLQPAVQRFAVTVEVTDAKDGVVSATLEILIEKPVAVENCTVPCAQIIRAGPPRCEDCIGMPSIPALHNPAFVAAGHPDAGYLTGDAMVIGVVKNREARAYPVLILNRHEIINDTFAGEPLTITYCPFTASPIVFSRQSGPAAGLTFDVSGFLYNTNLIMYDLQFQTLWSQMRFEAVKGKAIGEKLPIERAYFMTWAAWQRLFPGTRVVSSRTGHNKNYSYDEYARYNDSPYLWAPIHHTDERLPAKERIFGLAGDTQQRAYAWHNFPPQGLLSDRIDGRNILVIWDRAAQFVTAYYTRTSAGESDFTLVPHEPAFPFFLRDTRTGTRWDVTGAAIGGPLAGEMLEPVLPAYPAFWFAWAAIWPGTELDAE